MSEHLSPAENANDRRFDLIWREVGIQRDVALAAARSHYHDAVSEAEAAWAHNIAKRTTALIFAGRDEQAEPPPSPQEPA